MSYIKVDLELLEEIRDSRQCMILSFLINQSNDIENVKTQKWKQTTLAEMFKCSPRTIYNDLNKLEKDGWLTYQKSNYMQLRTTQITLSKKALSYREPQGKEEKVKNTTPSRNSRAKARASEQMSAANKYLEFIKNEMEKSNK